MIIFTPVFIASHRPCVQLDRLRPVLSTPLYAPGDRGPVTGEFLCFYQLFKQTKFIFNFRRLRSFERVFTSYPTLRDAWFSGDIGSHLSKNSGSAVRNVNVRSSFCLVFSMLYLHPRKYLNRNLASNDNQRLNLIDLLCYGWLRNLFLR